MEHGISRHSIDYLINLIDYHSISILRTNKNIYYSSRWKQEIISDVVIDHHSITSTFIEYSLLSKRILVGKYMIFISVMFFTKKIL